MFKNYLLVMFRNAWRQKGYSFINIFGLALGIAASVLILLFVRFELSYDRNFTNSQDLYRVNIHTSMEGAASYISYSPPALVPAIEQKLGNVKAATRIWILGAIPVELDGKEVETEHASMVDSSFFQVFDLPMRYGDPASALAKPHSIVLTDAFAQKLFGDSDPVGQTVILRHTEPYTVTGRLAPLPGNTHLEFDALCANSNGSDQDENWGYMNIISYLRLEPGTDVKTVESGCQEIFNEALGEVLRSYGKMWTIELYPVEKIHLYSRILGDPDTNLSITYVYGFIVISIFILILACINFINLSIAKSVSRKRELGMRKVLGAHRFNIIAQLIGESIFYALWGVLLAIVIIILVNPWFKTVTDRPIMLNQLLSPTMIIGFLSIIAIVGFVSGSFPALYLSSVQPISALRGSTTGKGGGSGLRRVLVIGQFVVSIALILATVTVFRQVQFLRNMDLGFDKEQVLTLVVENRDSDKRVQILNRLEQEFRTIPGVMDEGLSTTIPIGWNLHGTFLRPEGFPDDQPFRTWMIIADDGFLSALGIKLVEGRNFDDRIPTDNGEALIINETAVHDLNWEGQALGKVIPLSADMLDPNSPIRKAAKDSSDDAELPAHVIGVVKDFAFAGLRKKIESVIIYENRAAYSMITVRLAAQVDRSILSKIEEVWTQELPEQKFKPIFLDDRVNDFLRNDRRFGRIIESFTGLAVIIAALGLFGLATHTAERRTKELGVRKVLGASETGLVLLLTREYTWMVVIASVVGIPLSWYFINKWLEGFAYRIQVGVLIGLVTFLSAMLIAWLSVGWQAVRASRKNPVDCLRYE